jgi:hypothetical protein
MLCSKSVSYSAVRYQMGVQYNEQMYFKIHWWMFCKIYLKFTINLYSLHPLTVANTREDF